LIRDSEYFIFGNQRSDLKGISSVNVSSGLAEENFSFERKIIEKSIRGRSKPYFLGLEKIPGEIKLNVYFIDGFTDEQYEEVKDWLLGYEFYQPLIFSNYLNHVYWAMCVDLPKTFHNYNNKGYIEITFRTNDAYHYSPVYVNLFELENNPVTGTRIEINNIGNTSYSPTLEITKLIEDGDVSIFNLSDGNKEFKITNLHQNEVTTIDNDNQLITSIYNDQNIYRYDSHNGYFMVLPKGNNRLKIIGKCNLKIISEFKFL
jgi:phage-related protein